MTGYLGRLVARSTGDGAGATPRVPFRFEAAPDVRPTETGEGVPSVGAEGPPASAPVPAPAPPVARLDRVAPLPATAPTAEASTPRRESREAGRPATRTPTPQPVRPAPVDVADAPSRPLAAPGDPEPAGAHPVTAAGREVAPARPAALPVVVAVPGSASVPAVPVVPADAAGSGPDVVHVTIGRVEVRATLPPAPPVAPSPASSYAAAPPPGRQGDAGLTLHDYLRGERGAR